MGLSGPNIKKMEKKGDIDGLVGALEHKNSDVREGAAGALGRLGWDPGDELEKARYLTARRAWDELVELGDPALPPLVQALAHKDNNLKQLAGDTLENIALAHPSSAVDVLVIALEQESQQGFQKSAIEARNKVVDILGAIGDPRAAVPLIRSKRNLRDEFLRLHRDHRKPVEHVRDEYSELVNRTIQEFGESAVLPITQAIKEPENKDFLYTLYSMLGYLGEPAVEPLIQSLEDVNWLVRSEAASTLGTIGTSAAIGPLVHALQDEESHVRTSAAQALINLSWIPANDAERAYFLFAELLASSYTPQGGLSQEKADELVRMGIHAAEPLIQSLAVQGTVRANLPYEKSIVEVPASNVAISVLENIGEPAIDPLLNALENSNSQIRRNAAQILGEMKAARAVEPLTQALEDEDEKVREAARVALSKI